MTAQTVHTTAPGYSERKGDHLFRLRKIGLGYREGSGGAPTPASEPSA
jgi:hypothetical protein